MSDNHELRKRILIIVGSCLMAMGIIFLIIGGVSMGNFDSDLFVLFPIGIFSLAIGGVLLILAFHRDIVSYQAKYYAPILKELKEEVLPDKNVVTCPDCGTANDSDSKFCKECGKPLRKTCPYCNAEVHSDSKFCKECGRSL